ncbi:MAG: carbonic anhydrase [Leptospirillia bacterium]
MNKRILIAVAAYFALAATAWAGSGGHGSHWGYTGEAGPSHWGDLNDDYHVCKEGMKQSPINIDSATHRDKVSLAMNYKATAVSVLNNGHTIQVNYEPGSSMTVDGKTYNLLQFHFHSPSEHTYKGNPYPLEAHLVHKADDGSLAVVGVFFKEGAENPLLSKVWSAMPKKAGETMKGMGAVNIADVLPNPKAYWNYSGSLTTPPCSEGVNWFVMDKSIQASKAQIEQFLGVIHENARPVQPYHGRSVDHRM